jgi:hypothetical protein
MVIPRQPSNSLLPSLYCVTSHSPSENRSGDDIYALKNNRMMNVWFTFRGKLDRVRLHDDDPCLVVDLQDAIQDRYGDSLQCRAPDLMLFSYDDDSKPLSANAKISDYTPTDGRPLLIIISDKNTEKQNKKAKTSFPVEELMLKPNELRPPMLGPESPPFVCSKDWLKNVKTIIDDGLQEGDENHLKRTIQPMAFVRYSRGGKTRALREIANMELTCGQEEEPVKAIFVTFNEYSDLDKDDQDDPLRALLLRISFEGLKTRHDDGANNRAKFAEFRKRNFSFSPSDIMEWLGDTPALLVVGELNNLDELAVPGSTKAAEFARFVKDYFLSPYGRYFIFSTHVLSTLKCLGVYGPLWCK